MLILAIALLSLGGLVALISGVWTLALAFQRHVLWGLAVMVVPVGNIAFLFVNWREARAPFVLGLGSVLLMASAFFSMPKGSISVPFHTALHAYQVTGRAERTAAEQKMSAAREEASAQFRLLSLKRRQDALLERKASLTAGDRFAAQTLTAEINRYNAELHSALPHSYTQRIVSR